jgi:hypothetical protein
MTEISYSLTRRDLIVACFLIEWRRRANLILCSISAICFATVFTRFESPYALEAWLLLIGLFFVCGWIACLAVGMAMAGFKSGSLPGVLGRHIIRLTKLELLEQTDFNRSAHSWKAVITLRKSRNGILIRLAGGTYYFVPRRDFGSNDQFDAFYNAAKTFKDANAVQS